MNRNKWRVRKTPGRIGAYLVNQPGCEVTAVWRCRKIGHHCFRINDWNEAHDRAWYYVYRDAGLDCK